jgi:hypothetical protein
MGQAAHEAGRDRVAHLGEDDRQFAGRLPRRLRGDRPGTHQHPHAAVDQFAGGHGRHLGPAPPGTDVQRHLATLGIAELSQPLP